jgi:hypothetical protein
MIAEAYKACEENTMGWKKHTKSVKKSTPQYFRTCIINRDCCWKDWIASRFASLAVAMTLWVRARLKDAWSCVRLKQENNEQATASLRSANTGKDLSIASLRGAERRGSP